MQRDWGERYKEKNICLFFLQGRSLDKWTKLQCPLIHASPSIQYLHTFIKIVFNHHNLKHRARIAPFSQSRYAFPPNNTCHWTRNPRPGFCLWCFGSSRDFHAWHICQKQERHNGEILFAHHSRHNDLTQKERPKMKKYLKKQLKNSLAFLKNTFGLLILCNLFRSEGWAHSTSAKW